MIFERIKALYDRHKLTADQVYIYAHKYIITMEQARLIVGKRTND